MSLRMLKHSLLVVVALLAIFSTVNAQESRARVYKIAEAGIQMNLPAGWEASKDAKGTIVISKKDGGSYVLYSMSVLPRDPAVNLDTLYGAFSEGIFESAKKDWKGFKANPIMKDEQGGMAVRAQKIEGAVESLGGDLEGLVILIDSPKPLGIFGQRTKKQSDALNKESSDLLSSIAKIQ